MTAEASPRHPPQRAVDLARVRRLWTPLAASWALMAVEMPLLAAVVGRLPDEAVHLAAYGGIAFPIALVVEAPIIMLLAASTALCKDWGRYLFVRGFMVRSVVALTLLHGAIAFTPLYDLVAGDLLGSAPRVQEAGRLGLQLLLPWSGAIAYRRFLQGILIRTERSRWVGRGTVVRLAANALVLGSLAAWTDLPGIAVGSSAISAGVLAEAAFVGWAVRPSLASLRAAAPALDPPLDLARFLRFYLPLALTPLVTLLLHPLGSAAMNRLPLPLESLAVWPAVHGLVFLTRSVGFAYNEVVVALAEAPGAAPVLHRFRNLLALSTTGVLMVLAATPLAGLWFARASGLSPFLAALAAAATALAVPMPGLQALQSHSTGLLVAAHRTRGVTEAVVVFFAVSASLLALAVGSGRVEEPGILAASLTFTIAGAVQTAWLAVRARGLEGDLARP